MQQEEDYTTELLTKWAVTGHLVNVGDSDQVAVAQRLEAAHRRSLGPRGDVSALCDEMNKLRREGYIKASEGHDPRLRQVRRTGARDRHRGVTVPRMARSA